MKILQKKKCRQLYRKDKAYTEKELSEYITKCGITVLQDEVYSVNDEFTIIKWNGSVTFGTYSWWTDMAGGDIL